MTHARRLMLTLARARGSLQRRASHGWGPVVLWLVVVSLGLLLVPAVVNAAFGLVPSRRLADDRQRPGRLAELRDGRRESARLAGLDRRPLDDRRGSDATVRRVLDIWQDYFGHVLEWHFESDFARLEMIPLIEWDNAQSGYGFLEFGFGRTPSGTIDHTRPYCENFDVLAHELGHSIIFSEVGVPASPADEAVDYGGMHESSGDLVAIIGSLHFHSLVDHLLEMTKGNLLTINGLDRVGELSESREIRVALNAKRMSDVGDEPHERSLPLTGAIFDTMVEVFQQDLVEKGLISEDLRVRSTNLPGGRADIRDRSTTVAMHLVRRLLVESATQASDAA